MGWLRGARVRVFVVGAMVGTTLGAAGMVMTASPAFAAGCTSGTLVPTAHVDAFSTPTANQFLLDQGLPTYSNASSDPTTSLVRGKDTLARLFLSVPSCATSKQTITVNPAAMTISVANGSTALGTGSVFSPTGSFNLPASYTGAPPANLATDPILLVKGSVLAPAATTASYTATFTISVPYTTNLPSTGTATFTATATVAQKTNALRLLVVPMGNGTQTLSSQYSASADTAVQQAMNTLSRIYPVPCAADPTDPTGSCFREDLGSTFGGVRYAVNPGMLDLTQIAGTTDSNGKFCLGTSSWDGVKSTLGQFLNSWNSANPATPADRVVGVVDEAISDGAATSPSGVSCADGMSSALSTAAFVRAMYASQPSPSGGLLAMEVEHSFGGVPYPRSGNLHSLNTNADVTAPNRAYNVTQRGQITTARSAMQYGATGWNNDTTGLEQLDYQLDLCNFGGPTDTECTTAGTTGTTNGVAAGNDTFVLSGTTQNTAASTNVVMSFFSQANQPTSPDPQAPDASSSYRLVQSTAAGTLVNDVGVHASLQDTDHDEASGGGTAPTTSTAALSIAVPGFTGVGKIDLYWCGATPTVTCENDPADFGGILLYDRTSSPPSFTNIVGASAGNVVDYTNDHSRDDTDPALHGGSVAWVAPCTTQTCPSGITSIHVAPSSNARSLAEVPITPDCGGQTGPAWKPDGTALVFASGGDLYTVTVNTATTPYTLGTPKLVYAKGQSSPAADTPTVSADGSTIYFHSAAGGLQSVPFAGGKSSPVVSSPSHESAPSASPTNAHLLAYQIAGSSGPEVWTLDPTNASPGKTAAQLVTNASSPWVGDDGRVYFTRAGSIWSVKTDKTGLTQVSAGSSDANGTESGGVVGFDRPTPDREVMLANLSTTTVTATVSDPNPGQLRGELDVQCPNGQIFPVAVGIAPQQLPPTAAQFAATFDGTHACNGSVKLIFKVSDGLNLVSAGPSQQITVLNSPQFVAAAITAPTVNGQYQQGSTIAFNGSGTSLTDGFLTGSHLKWFISGPTTPSTQIGAGNAFDAAPPAGGWPLGPLTVTLQATDSTGHTATDTRQITIDGTTPQVSLSSSVTNPTNQTSATFTIGSTDPDNASASYLCELDGGALAPCTSPVSYTGLPDGTHTFIVYAFDGANNTTSTSFTWLQDSTPPTTTASESPPPTSGGWYDASDPPPVTVTLNAADSGTGVQSITYTLAGATTGGQTISGSSTSFTVSNPGVTTVTYRATDNVGNVEPARTLSVAIDLTGPASTITGSLITTNGDDLTGTASDDISGVASVRVTLTNTVTGSTQTVSATCSDGTSSCFGTGAGTGGTPVQWYVPLSTLFPGTYNAQATATDVAGNVGPPSNVFTITI